MPNSHIVTNSISQQSNNHATQIITPDYTGIWAFCGTVFIISMITLAVINKISEKCRLDSYKLKQEEIKYNCYALKDLSSNLKSVKILLEGLITNGNNNIINN